MASLVSPGTSVTIDDQSFYVPAAAPTLPLIFIATQANKKQTDGISTALGTAESGVIRTVTSIRQSLELYGLPKFRKDSSGNQLHGDCRNEYGVATLNEFLRVANRAYVVRGNVDLADVAPVTVTPGTPSFTGTGNGTIGSISGGLTSVSETITVSLSSATAFTVTGSVSGSIGAGTVGTAFTNGKINFTIIAGSTPFTSGAAFTIVLTVTTGSEPLGATQVDKRAAIVTALQAVINTTEDVRSEVYEYNLLVCPGYPELADEMVSLSQELQDEVFVLGDVPMNMTPSEVKAWGATTARQKSTSVAYWYGNAVSSNLDGVDVVLPSSSVALKTIAYSDSISEVWFAPAGVRNGVVTHVSDVGYVSGTLGTATSFVSVALNQGQRDDLYQDYTNINPIVAFPTRGLLVWGQKTSAVANSALDRINVVRMLMYIKRALRKASMPFVFRPNDAITRADLKTTVDSFLADIMVKRGLYDFATICNETNNTGVRIDNNELWIDVALKPTKAAEFIYIPITVVNTADAI